MLGSTSPRGRRVLAALLCTAALGTASCGGENDEPAGPNGPVLLSLAVYGPEPVITAYSTIAANFSTENPGTSISITRYADARAAQAAIGKQIATGTVPDLFLSPLEALPGLDRAGAIQQVGSLLLDRDVDFGDGYQRYALEAFSSDSSLQCMPVDSSPLVVYYNTDLVDLAEVNSELEEEVTAETGWTFEQFETAAREPRAAGVRGLYVEPTLDRLAPFVFSGGGALLDNNESPTRLALSDGSAQGALEDVLPLLRDPVVNFSEEEIDEVPALERFEKGQLAMVLGFRSLTPALRAVEGLQFDVMPMPKVGSEATVGESSGLCLSDTTDHVDQAADFLAYAVSDEAAALLAGTGYTVPSNNAIAQGEAFLQVGQQPASATVFTDQVRSIRPLPTDPAWPAVLAATAPLLSKLFYDPLIESLDERLNDIDEASASLFEGDGATPSASPTS